MPNNIEFERLNWMQVEQRLIKDKRVVIPVGSTEQHAYLSLLTDTIIVDHVTRQACSNANVLLAPVMPFGCSAFATNYPGTISLRTVTLCQVVEDIIDCFYRQGFRRLIFVTGHGGNEVITGVLSESQLDRPQLVNYYYDAWAGMKESVDRIEKKLGLPESKHAAWHEDTPLTRVAEVPDKIKSFPQSSDFPSFPLNPRTAAFFLKNGVESGKIKAQHETTEKLVNQCIEAMIEFLINIPKESPEH